MSLLPWFSLVQSGRQRSAFFRYGITASSVGLSLLAGLWLRPFSYRVPYLPFIASILISLLYGGFGAGITATILSAVLANYFFFPPYGYFSSDASDIFVGLYFCLSFGIICWLIDAKWERAEAKRIESESRVRLFIEHAPAALAMFDCEMRYLQASRRWRIDYGLGDRDLDGVSHYEIFPEIPARWKDIHRRALAGEVLGEEHDRFERADGSVQWIRWEARPWRDSEGMIGGIVIFADDVTERKQAADVRERLAAVVDSSEDAIIAKRLDGTINAWNSGAEKVFGYSHAEAIGKPIQMLLPPERAREEADILARIRRGESVEHFETVRIRKDGTRIDVSVTISPIRDITGAIVGASKVARDITDRKRAEEALFKSEERFSKAFRNNPLAITISTEAEGRYLDVNDAFLNMLGYQRKDVIGSTAKELRFWSEPLDREEMLRHLKEEEKVAKHHTKYRTAKGEIRESEVWAELIELDGQRCILGITRDVTDMKKLEAQFRQAQKMEAVGRLAGGVAHDFNNVLGIVMGYSDIALGEIPTDTPVKKYLSEIKKASQRAALITRQLLAFSRQQVVFPKILDLNDVVRNVTTMFLRLVGEDIEIEFRPGTAIGSIKADPGQIEQILMNLVVNARDAMPTGGKITIETGTSELDEHYTSRHAGAHEGKHVVLKVSDTGSGMDETTRSQIFEPFFTTKAPGKGTGLGLSTVYGIVKQSDGYISVYSEPGKGTTFKIYFPMLREKAEELGSHREEAEPPRGSETILVVEDDKILRGLAVKLLQEGGYHVIEAEDAENALKILSSTGVEVDLLLTDIVMPGKTGVELLAEAKRIRQNLRAVFMSGYAGDLVTQHGVLVQEHSFLEKPFTKRALLTKVYSVLHGKT
jgi:two-component system cell cycle sensor histidine kinase/response regulator CckA